MDHLRSPSNPVQSIEVPLYEETEYDRHGDFFTYGSRRRLNQARAHPDTPPERKVTMIGAIAFFRGVLEMIQLHGQGENARGNEVEGKGEDVEGEGEKKKEEGEDTEEEEEESQSRRISGYIKALEEFYSWMRDEAAIFKTQILPGLQSKLNNPVTLAGKEMTPALKSRMQGWIASMAHSRASKDEKSFLLDDAISFLRFRLVDVFEREYLNIEEFDKGLEFRRELFDMMQEHVRFLQRVAFIVPDDIHLQPPTPWAGQVSGESPWRRRTGVSRWRPSAADNAYMILFAFLGDFNKIKADAYYDGRDPAEHENDSSDFTVWNTKQREALRLVRSMKTWIQGALNRNWREGNTPGEPPQLFRAEEIDPPDSVETKDFDELQEAEEIENAISNTAIRNRSSSEDYTLSVVRDGDVALPIGILEESMVSHIGSATADDIHDVSSNTAKARSSVSRQDSDLKTTNLLTEFPSRFFERQTNGIDEEIEARTDVDPMLAFISATGPLPPASTKSSEVTTNEAVLAGLQTWLFFGTLYEVFATVRILAAKKDFVKLVDGKQIVTSEKLRFFIDGWRQREQLTLTPDTRNDRAQRIDMIISLVSQYVTMFDDIENKQAPPSLFLSISVLCLTLRTAFLAIYTPSAPRLEYTSQIYRLQSRYLRDQLLESGWCLNLVQFICSTWSLPLQYYAFQMGNPARGTSRSDHSECSRQVCEASQIDQKNYVTRHVSGSPCPCEALSSARLERVEQEVYDSSHLDRENEEDQVSAKIAAMFISDTTEYSQTPGSWCASANELDQILDDGSFPVIVVPHPSFSPSDPQPRLMKFVPGLAFVAISHVWADGLGNPRENSLPLCQIERLRNYVANLSASGPSLTRHHIAIWIDTLCVPVNNKESRRKAITRMHQVYRQSHMVLVVDEGLLQHDLPEDALETLVRVRTSTWERRMWTFQEAGLAANVAFQFRNKASQNAWYLFRDSSPNLQDEMLDFGVTRDALQISWYPPLNLRDHYPGQEEEATAILARRGLDHTWSQFHLTWKAFQRRSTSRAPDQVTCLGTIANLPLDSILAEHEMEARMKAYLELQKTFPSNIIFVCARRIVDDGYSWAPSSLLSPVSHLERLLWSDDASTLVPLGLEVEFPGILFPKNELQISPIDEGRYYAWVHLDSTAGLAKDEPVCCIFSLELPEDLPEDWIEHEPDTVAIILQAPLLSSTTASRGAGALVSVAFQEDDYTLVVKFKCTVSVLCTTEIRTIQDIVRDERVGKEEAMREFEGVELFLPKIDPLMMVPLHKELKDGILKGKNQRWIVA